MSTPQIGTDEPQRGGHWIHLEPARPIGGESDEEAWAAVCACGWETTPFRNSAVAVELGAEHTAENEL
jgi:hypothetical protein